MYDGMNLYRAVVSYSSASTGDIQVKIPSVLGSTEVVPICKIGRSAVNDTWSVPLVGSQVVVAVEDDRFSNVYVVYPSLSGLSSSASTPSGGGASTPSGGGASTPTVVESVPSGAITQFAGSTAPSGWLLCNGSEVSRTTYSSLFLAIGTTYGIGNGSTTFNLPNLSGRVPIGKDSAQTAFNALNNIGGTSSITLAEANLPAHAHSLSSHTHGLSDHTHTLAHTHTGSSDSHTHDHGDTGSGGSHTHTYFDNPRNSSIQYASGTAGQDRSSTTANTGSSGSHSHSIANDSHSHSISTSTQSTSTSSIPSVTSSSGPSTTNTGNGSGSSATITTISPYIVLNYIIKV